MPFAACLAARGLRVIGVDVDSRKVEAVNDGRCLGHEPMLAETLTRAGTNLSATVNLEAAVADADVTFVLVQTPSTPQSGISVEFVRAACAGIGNALARKDGYHLVVVSSTMPPGSMDETVRPALEANSGKRCGRDFGLCYAPEFVAFGALIEGFLHPPFVLVGQHDERAGDELAALYETFLARPAEIVRTSIAVAELAKIALNALLAAKISFANLLARICEHRPGVDVNDVTAVLERDPRVGRGFLRGGVSFGGPCLPRDLAALRQISETAGVDAGLLASIAQLNSDRVRDVERLVHEEVRRLERESGRPPVVAILGLAFKPGTDSTESSFGVLLCERLSRLGLRLMAHDPIAAMGDATGARTATLEECGGADVIVIATPWPQYAGLAAEAIARSVIIDCWRILPPTAAGAARKYICLGTEAAFGR